MSNTFTLQNSRGDDVVTIGELKTKSISTLTFHGRGHKFYGLDRLENTLFLMENFAGTVAPSNPVSGQTWWNTANNELYVYNDVASPAAFERIVTTSAGIGFNVIAGAGLTGGGRPQGSPLSITVNVGSGTGITVDANSISINNSQISHTSLLNYVGDEHIDHGSIVITHGSGFSSSSGNLTQSQTLNLGAGTGITVNADDIAVNSIVVRTTGNQTIVGPKNFLTPTSILMSDGTAGAPALAFEGDPDTGIYRSGNNELSFSTGGTQRFRIESNGILRSLNTGYESLVTEDDDIPNKKYVDDLGAGVGGSAPTQNYFTGTSSLTGLSVGRKYLIHVYGNTRAGSGVLGQIRIYQTGTGTPGSGPFLASSPYTGSINWPDGQAPQSATLIWTATVPNISAVADWTSSSWQTPMYMTAIQLTF